MKKVLACAIAFFGVSVASGTYAGNIEHRLDVNGAAGVSDQAVRNAIVKGISAADRMLPNLPKPWQMVISLYGGTKAGDPQPGIIYIRKSKDAGKDGETVKCSQLHYGTYGPHEILVRLEQSVTEAASIFTQHENCK